MVLFKKENIISSILLYRILEIIEIVCDIIELCKVHASFTKLKFESNLENLTLLKKFDSLVEGLIQPPFGDDVEFALAAEPSDDSLCCLLFDLSFVVVFSFDAVVFEFLLEENDIVGNEGRVRVDFLSTLLLLEIRLGRLTI